MCARGGLSRVPDAASDIFLDLVKQSKAPEQP